MGNQKSVPVQKNKKKFNIIRMPEANCTSPTFDDFLVLKFLGNGKFSEVSVVQRKGTEYLYALKHISKTSCIQSSVFKNVIKEIQILSLLEHPFLVNLWYTYRDVEDVFMVVDLIEGGDLRYHLQQRTWGFDECSVTLYLSEIALALEYMAKKRVVHRDIKPENILLDLAGHVHIADFNVAALVTGSRKLNTVIGTKAYMAPEVVACALDSNAKYSFAADWWSLGVMTYELLVGKRPYDISENATMEEILAALRTPLLIPRCVDNLLGDLILEMLRFDPSKRSASIDALRKHPFFDSVDFNEVLKLQVPPLFVPPDKLHCSPTYELSEIVERRKQAELPKKEKPCCSCFSTSSADRRSPLGAAAPNVPAVGSSAVGLSAEVGSSKVTSSAYGPSAADSATRGLSARGSSAVDSEARVSSAANSSARGSSAADSSARGSSAADSSARGSSAADSSARGSSAADSSARGSSAADSSVRGSSAADSSARDSSAATSSAVDSSAIPTSTSNVSTIAENPSITPEHD